MPYKINYIPQLFTENLRCGIKEFRWCVDGMQFTVQEPLGDSYDINLVHGDKVVHASSEPQQADAQIIAIKMPQKSKVAKKYLAIKTADCLPIAFRYVHSSLFIGGIAHAGWRGLSSSIISKTLAAMSYECINFGVPEQSFWRNVLVFMGPAIFGVTYECGEDVREALKFYKKTIFQEKQSQSTLSSVFDICADVKLDAQLARDIEEFSFQFHYKLQNDRIFPDLQLLAAIECVNLGIPMENICVYRENTYTHQDIPSYRASRHRMENGVKRLWTHLCL